jgi:hypothetical protein
MLGQGIMVGAVALVASLFFNLLLAYPFRLL